VNNTAKQILEKMMYHNYIGKHHITEINLCKSFNRNKHDEIKDAIKELVKQGYITKYPHQPNNAYSIPPQKIREIQRQLEHL
jgi:outer membrane protein assembly factor BamD (BamD/ComL family)